MKLRNKKTGVIVDVLANPVFTEYNRDGSVKNVVTFNSLAELNEEWEDYEEPKEYWFIDCGTYEVDKCEENEDTETDKEIGNYFETEEEAELAVRKLKAWKRLKDNGFEFKRWEIIDGRIDFMILPKGEYREKVYDDLDLLFGGKK